MPSPQQGSEMHLQVRRVFAAPREKVYRAWLERAGLEQWMCRDSPQSATRYRDFDIREGVRKGWNGCFDMLERYV